MEKEVISERIANAEETKFLDSERIKKGSGPRCGKRHEQMVIFFFLLLVSFSIKVSINIALVAMTEQTSTYNRTIPTYEWTDKNVIISAFFWGYVLPQVGAGWLATHYGPKWFLVGSMMASSIAGFLIPMSAAYFGSKGVMICRALQGVCQGFVIPSVHMLLARWVPKDERSMVSSIVYAGTPCGTVFALIVTGYISASSYGWPMSFYFFNGLSLIWVVWFSLCGYSSPGDHPTISQEEKYYIETSLGFVENKKVSSTPWKRILTSTPFWALVLTQSGFTWGFWTLLSEIPLYMDKVMRFNLKSNSLLSSLPYLSHWLFMILSGYIADQLMSRKIFKVRTVRRLMNSVGFTAPAIALFILGDSGPESAIKALVLLVIAVGVSAIASNGFFINHMDLSPNHAGVIMGISNFLASLCAIAAPLFVQVFVTDEHNPNQWKIVFYSASAIYIVSNFVFICFGSTNVQPWNEDDSEDGEKV
ncbi:putative inorganic phosphate cotransporter [Leptinotarsa decemlineata]|uniref:putative inorganic phosphate cotransporter n=1 Tax=Leptinotarsa decemlineata TaxID=7539 RepID=UPI003D3074FC